MSIFKNPDLYPTPVSLANKMLSKVKNWDKINSILEPSAGLGHLINATKEYRKYYQCVNNISAIELDPNCAATLRGMGVNVIDSDFLFYNGLEQFDLIIANFPFSDGDRHLHKAIDILFSGQIVCLLNAETIKNPYNNSRKDLISKLNKLGASIEYIQNAFAEADRKTNVEVALIHIEKIKEVETDLFNDVTQNEDEILAEDLQEKNELATLNQIGNLVKRYNQDKDSVTNQIIEFYKNYKSVSKYLILSVTGQDDNEIRRSRWDSEKSLTNIMKSKLNQFAARIKAEYWHEAMKLDDVRKRLTSAKKEELSKYIKAYSKMEFTEANIRQFVINLIDKFPLMIDEAIEFMFDKITSYALRERNYGRNEYATNIHYYNGWKTNQAYKINKKVILPFYVGWSGIHTLSWEQESFFDDLDLVVSYFDAAAEAPRTGYIVKHHLQSQQQNKGIETKYFIIDIYKKGTMHIRFKDEDILRRFNIHIGKLRNYLPMDYGHKPKSDLSSQEEQIVKDFEGLSVYKQTGKTLAIQTPKILMIGGLS